MQTLTILKAARLRLEIGTYNPTICLCSLGLGLNKPVRPDLTWCIFCAIEASQITGKFSADCYGICVAEMAFEISGVRFSLERWIERDAVFLGWMDNHPKKEDAIALFDKVILRVERTEQ